MANSYRLGDADRERLGAPEWMPLELMDVTLGQITELSDRYGFEMEDWPEILYGQEDVRKAPKWQLQAAVWLALHQNGVNIPWEDVATIAALRVQFRADESPGKDEGSNDSPQSESFESPTTPPSSTSTPDSPEES